MKLTLIFAATVLAAADVSPDKILPARAPAVTGVEQPKQLPSLNTPTVQGCFKSSGDLKLNQTITWNSIGKCATEVCLAGGYPVGGTMGGNQCWCGNTYPPKKDEVDDKFCNVGCTGFGEQACGGIDYWTIYNTGLTLSVKYLDDDEGKTSSSTQTQAPSSVVTLSESTLVVTETPTETPNTSSSGGGTNVAGVAAGVVVSVVVVAAAIGGVYLYMRRKRNQEIEEEHRRNAAVNAFIGKPPGSSGGLSMTDSRLDPVLAQRRLSDGSIADNQDYSRRILRVTNA
ncbi:hypothetical protein VTK56DRAFT_2965 [Thermocarpiscus australiensis]